MKKKFSKILGVGLTLALLASLLLVAAPVSALTQPSVTPSATTISATASYSLLFTVGADLPDVGNIAGSGKIVVAFPTGTDLTNVAAADVSLAATSGIGSTAYGATPATTIVKSPDATGPTVTITMPDVASGTDNKTGVGAMVQVVIADVINPATAGSYTLAVSTLTSADVAIEAAVTSAAYTITVPTIAALPGIVKVYNVAGVLVAQGTGSTAIQTAIDAATTATGYTIKIGPGTYTENPNTTDAGVTFVATGTAAETIIIGTFTINVGTTTLDGLTITGGIVGTGAATATIKNSIIKPSTAPTTLLAIDAASTPFTITNTSFAVTGTVVTSGITIESPAIVSVTGSTFTVDTGGKGIASDGTLTVTNGTFTGSSGIGIDVYGGTATVTGATFDTLTTALNITGGTVTATKNIIKNSTGDAINIAAATKVTITSNDILNTAATKYAVVTALNANVVYVVFNNITGNTLNVKNTDAVNTLSATHNWWGVATGPATTSISGLVSTAGYLTGAATAGTGAVATGAYTLTGKTTAGVDVVATGTALPTIVAASKYAANPVAVAPLYTALTGGYFDVYVAGGTLTSIDIKLYGAVAAEVTTNTKAYFWNALQGTWVVVPVQGANTLSGFVYITVTTTSTPAIADLSGLPFVLVQGPPAVVTLALTAPTPGATTPVTNVPFTWASVAGATSYALVISANADLSSSINATATGIAYTYSGTLDYSTPYYWQVTALTGTTVLGKSDIATFVTRAAPVVVAPAPFVIVSPTVGEPNVSIEPTLTWTAFEGAISYEIAVSREDPTFAILEYSHNVLGANTFYKSETLAYGTTYYWRVKGITGPAPAANAAAPSGPWVTGVFTTESEPVAPAKVEPTIIVQKEPAPPAEVKIVEVPVQTIVPQPIPNYLLWTIIGVGAVLIIALIVLIARNRRVT